MHPRAGRVPRYLAAHAAMGAVLGGLLGAVLLFTDVLGLAGLVVRDPLAIILIPAFAALFALAAGATALAMLGEAGEEGLPHAARGAHVPRDRLAAVRIRTRR